MYFAEELASKTDPYRLEIMDPEQVSKLGLVLHLFQTRPRCEDCMIVGVAIKPHGHPISIYCSIATCSENKNQKYAVKRLQLRLVCIILSGQAGPGGVTA